MRTKMSINKLGWMLRTGKLKEINEFQVNDTFKILFCEPMEKAQAVEFIHFVKGFDTRDNTTVEFICLWLRQHNILFKLTVCERKHAARQ